MFDKVDQLGVNTIRTLSIDAVQKANSGHPGLPLGAAPMAYALWTKFLKINPKTSRNWPDRDRFVLSAGHGSAMLYSLLHLAGYDVSMEDLKNFRQLDSKTPGHPEVHYTDGVEATTGPLGQGLAMAVGMAMAESHLAATYNQKEFSLIDHYTYALCGDGDLMEGVSQEASSLAGHLKLGKLIVLYDSNNISLDGPTSKSFTENVGARYEAYGWQHLLVKDGNNLEEIAQAITTARDEKEKPTLIEVKTIIGYGSPKAGTSSVHGAPIGAEGITAAKESFQWTYPDFTIPNEVQMRFQESINKKGEKAEATWQKMFDDYSTKFPDLAKQFIQAFSDELPENWESDLPTYEEGTSAASRITSKETIQAISKNVPAFLGGSADLSSSNNTMVTTEKDFEPTQFEGRNIWFGVREFAMACAMNGMQLHGGCRVYGGTFFVFTDYLRPAIRLAAIQKLPVTYVLTHDSVAVGEDGPTHEPVEQLASVRAMPNVQVLRPADGNETVAAWKIAMTSKETPTILILSRQNLPVIKGTKKLATSFVSKGAYVISPQKQKIPQGILIATGSEVHLAIEAQKGLADKGIDVSVVSMPSFDLFEQQSQAYKDTVFPKTVTKRLAIEAAASFGWERYVGFEGKTITIDHFGLSGNGNAVMNKLGFTVENIIKTFEQL
ncbi:transketolase [Melissococcus plutonius]|uniref:Transketolase n=1 Tax=Melissococcus plutonius (strain ATCC 35311 / DSM 29964 / CIP 104052 / LMG 20360 / NCIMB 702443) TaxID=940190 RepID=F3YAL0_MELPT|nr:transketolase [Melissococcus plutonius]AIM24999.1 transketolase Tkt [Melissococcus plutonius S1]KMT25163.1 transketolase Tkt [Melissococcus plutonius]KMT26800.1 transketolase Tkt [Melissococcus plutonius]KMT28050.1 transketolase Tkt [Melissococcus plutonius]KMT29823.1 transketolase Tkt [Melissococcus plutonius]